MIWLSILRDFPLGRLSIITPKASTIRLRNSSDFIVFPLKVTEISSQRNSSNSHHEGKNTENIDEGIVHCAIFKCSSYSQILNIYSSMACFALEIAEYSRCNKLCKTSSLFGISFGI